MDRFMEQLSSIAKVLVKEDPKPDTITVTGRAKEYNGKMYVQIDGSDQLTPIASSTVNIKTDDWVTVQIKNHSATITGNATDPSPGTSYADEINGKVDDVSDQISEFEIVIADKVDTEQLNAVNGRIDNLVSENVTITGKLEAAEGEIDQLQAENVTITGELDAAKADIDYLTSSKADITVLESQYATIENLEATNANIHNLEVDYGSFKQITTEDISAINGNIANLETTKLDAESADIRYAQIDFANIGEAAIEKLFTQSGIIGDLVVSEGHITGHLVGVTISGDLIEGNTIKADKLVVLGSDGLYYKLNVNAESVAAEQTDYNSINGKIITANTITAEKINVDDLVAFKATIGGFHLSDNAIYSGAKSSVANTTAGTYLGSDGQLNIGDQNQYLKFYKDTDGTWKLEIAASAIKMGTTSVSDKIDEIEGKVDKSIKSSVEQFYLSTSPTALSGGSWSASQPTWQNGRYIWRRTLVTYNDGSTAYTPSANGVCITGNTGPQGTPGSNGSDGSDGVGIKSSAVTYQAGSSGTTVPTGTWSSSIPSVAAGQYLWTKTVITYTDGKSTTSYSVGRMGQNGANGANGANGDDGRGIKSTTITYQAGTSQTSAPTSTWTTSVPTLTTAKPYLWTRTIITYTDNATSTAYSVSSTLESFEVGGTNLLRGSSEGGTDYVSAGSETITLGDGWNGNPSVHTTGAWTGYYIRLGQALQRIGAVVGDVVTLSIYVSCSSSTPVTNHGHLYLYRAIVSNTCSEDFGNVSLQNGKWVRLSYTFEVNDYALTINSTRFEASSTVSDYYIKWSCPKLEKGNKATDWTPAPEDVNDRITEAVDNVEVGGRNLIFASGDMPIGSDRTTEYDSSYGDSGKLTDTGEGLKLTFDGQTYTSLTVPLVSDGAISNSETVTLSFKYRGNITDFGSFYFIMRTTPNVSLTMPDPDGISETEWKQYTWTFSHAQANIRTNYYLLLFYGLSKYDSTHWIEIKKGSLKLEKGNKPTDWTPAPEDVDQKLEDQRTELQEEIDTSIEQVEGQIVSTVEATYTTKDEFENEIATIGTQITQNQDSVNFQFSQLNSSLADLNSFKGTAGSQLETITKYIRFLNGDIVLGGSDSDVQLKLENDRIAFLDSNNEVMYITNEELYIMRAIIATQLTIGDFSWVPRSNGNVSFRYIGG